MAFASDRGCLDCVTALLEAGADANWFDWDQATPIHWAAKKNHVAVAQLLLAAGADLSIENKEGLTPLKMALEKGHTEMIALLEPLAPKRKVRKKKLPKTDP